MKFAVKFFDTGNDAETYGKHVTALLPANAKGFLLNRIFDFAGTCLAALTALLLLSVASYDPSDSSLNSATVLPPNNLIGYPGAIVADLLMQTFGYGIYFLIAGMATWSWRLFRKRVFSHSIGRAVALILAVIASGVGLSGYSTAGGALGTLVYNQIVDLIATAGWTDSGFHVSVIAITSACLLWIFGLGLTWMEWRIWGSRVFSGSRFLGHCFISISRCIGFTQIWKHPTTERVTLDNPESGLPEVSGLDMPSVIDEISLKNPELDRSGLVAPRRPKPKTGKRAKAARQGKLNLEPKKDTYVPPSLDLLEFSTIEKGVETLNKDALEQNAKFLATVLSDFGIKGEIAKVRPGPVVTLYELEPAPGTKTSRVISLSDDIARSMSAVSVRVAVVPGRNAIGIELPNVSREMVFLRELLASADFERSKSRLPLALGKDIGGSVIVVDLARMPHLLIAGTTGSGKSVAMNTMILSLLFSLSPEECRLIMIDPKMLELSVYEGIPHLLTPVVTDPSKAITALKWAVREMEDRYRNMSQLGVRNIAGYNARIKDALKKGEVLTRQIQTGFDDEGMPIIESLPLPMTPLPFIVVVVDEMADLMLVAGKDVEAAIQRLAQMARAAGIHLIMATQRPSVDVITGTVKANFPTRVSFQVTSKIDSRTILGEQGAEQLLGQGDMLYMAGGGRVSRVHGPFVSDDEVEQIVDHLKVQASPVYIEDVTIENENLKNLEFGNNKPDRVDELYDEAVAIVSREGKASTSFIQRHLQIGYNRAARIIEEMEKEGVISPANRVGRREVLIGAH